MYDPIRIAKMIYFSDPFVESIPVSEYLNARTDKGDKIAVLGSEPQIYFYSKRLSATGYIYAYSLMESQPYALQMQKEMAREVESSCPRFIVWVDDWPVGPDSERYILGWIDNYISSFYRLAGTVYILSDCSAVYNWNGKKFSDQAIVEIYERRQACAK